MGAPGRTGQWHLAPPGTWHLAPGTWHQSASGSSMDTGTAPKGHTHARTPDAHPRHAHTAGGPWGNHRLSGAGGGVVGGNVKLDTLLGGVACIIAALGLLGAAWAALRPGADDGQLTCVVSGFRVVAAPCNPTTQVPEGTDCWRIHTSVKLYDTFGEVLGQEPWKFPTEGPCLTSHACVDELQKLNTSFGCFYDHDDELIVGLQSEAEDPRDRGPGWFAAALFWFLVSVPVPFCCLMGACLVFTGITRRSPFGIADRWRCDFDPAAMGKKDDGSDAAGMAGAAGGAHGRRTRLGYEYATSFGDSGERGLLREPVAGSPTAEGAPERGRDDGSRHIL